MRGAEIVDRTKRSGDAVTPANATPATPGGRPAELVYRACDFGSGAPGTRSGASSGTRSVTVEVSGEGTLELALDDGEMIAHLDIAPTAGPYAYASVTTPFDASGVHDLRIGLRGPLRLAHVGFAGPLPPGR